MGKSTSRILSKQKSLQKIASITITISVLKNRYFVGKLKVFKVSLIALIILLLEVINVSSEIEGDQIEEEIEN